MDECAVGSCSAEETIDYPTCVRAEARSQMVFREPGALWPGRAVSTIT